MVRLLPFILIPLLILGGLWYWRNLSFKPTLNTPQVIEQVQTVPVEVPRTYVDATKEPSAEPAVSDARFTNLAAEITDLKTRISVLEKAPPAPAAAASKYPLYIPLGAGGGPWTDQSWTTLTEYQAAINPDNYAGYTGMQLEVNFRLTEAAGTGSVRLFNSSDNSATSSQLDTTSS